MLLMCRPKCRLKKDWFKKNLKKENISEKCKMQEKSNKTKTKKVKPQNHVYLPPGTFPSFLAVFYPIFWQFCHKTNNILLKRNWLGNIIWNYRNKLKWYSNQRPLSFKSSALPSELPSPMMGLIPVNQYLCYVI